MTWKSLDEIYKENVALYTKKGNEYELLANVDQKYYDDILTRYVKMGSVDSIEGRKNIEERLEKAGGNIGNNLDIFQSYSYKARFELQNKNFTNAQTDFLNLVNNSAAFTLDKFVESSFHNSDVYNNFFDKAWCALPEAPTHGAPGCGELYLAFLCNGVKPKKGDLSVGGFEIELKGPGGRLLKTASLNDDFSELDKDVSSDEEAIQNIGRFIANYAGAPNYADEVIKLIKDNNLQSTLVQEREYFLQRRKLRPGMGKLGTNLLIYIGGIIQLFEYKKLQGFDAFLAFNQSGEDLILQSINMQNLTTLSDFYKLCNDLKTTLRFSRRKDGKGWSLTITP